MAVAALQMMVLEAPGHEELAKLAPSLEELASKLAQGGRLFMVWIPNSNVEKLSGKIV